MSIPTKTIPMKHINMHATGIQIGDSTHNQLIDVTPLSLSIVKSKTIKNIFISIFISSHKTYSVILVDRYSYHVSDTMLYPLVDE